MFLFKKKNPVKERIFQDLKDLLAEANPKPEVEKTTHMKVVYKAKNKKKK